MPRLIRRPWVARPIVSRMASTLRRVVFLDRDGTLIHDPGYLGDPAGVRLLPEVGEGLRLLANAGWSFVVATNQSGIARGRYTVDDYQRVAQRVEEALAAEGVSLLAAYMCPYHPEGTVAAYAMEHEDRKPNPGMWLRAARDLALDLGASWTIGDGERDIVAGKRAGTRAILLAAGRDKWPLFRGGPFAPDFVARDMLEAATWLESCASVLRSAP